MKSLFVRKVLGAVLRHGISGAGGWLVAMGLADESTASEVIGAVTVLAGFVLSVAEKRFGLQYRIDF